MHFASLIANDTGVIKFFSWWPGTSTGLNWTTLSEGSTRDAYNPRVKVCPARKLISSNNDDNSGKMRGMGRRRKLS